MSGDVLVCTIDRCGVKRMVVETKKLQNNMTASDPEAKANPEMVKAAILAGKKR